MNRCYISINSEKLHKLVAERDALRSRVAELEKVLIKIRDTFGYSDDTFDEYRKMAKQALKEGA